MSLARSIGHSVGCKLTRVRNAVNFYQIWRTLTASLTFSLPLAKILVCWSWKLKLYSLKNTRLMYTVFVRFYFAEKSALLKGRSRSRFLSKTVQVNRDFGQDGRRKYDRDTSEGVPCLFAYSSLSVSAAVTVDTVNNC